jgi:hypothetical protein
VPPATIHGFVGTPDGRLRAYYCIQPAAERSDEAPIEPLDLDGHDRAPTLAAADRPLFPTEIELCGPEVFPSLPYARETAVAQVRELTYLLRNQAIPTPLSIAAMVEAFNSAAQIIVDPRLHIRLAIGNASREARQTLAYLGIPALYAPASRVAPRRDDYYWLDAVNVPGNFWPFAIATDDLRAHAAHFRRIDDVLSLPPTLLRRQLLLLLRRPQRTPPWALLAKAGAARAMWTTDLVDAYAPDEPAGDPLERVPDPRLASQHVGQLPRDQE